MKTIEKVSVCSLDELKRDRFKVVSAGSSTILVGFEEGKLFALDNRCPHMGFPLHRGDGARWDPHLPLASREI